MHHTEHCAHVHTYTYTASIKAMYEIFNLIIPTKNKESQKLYEKKICSNFFMKIELF